jgi:tetratricopeptide (TPR) repeat protein
MSKKHKAKNVKSRNRSDYSIQPSVTAVPKSRTEINYILFLLTAITFFIYSGTLSSDFAYYDDDVNVTSNEHVCKGLTLGGIKWAFTSVGYSDNWHPLTWLSHMLDVQLFGLNPGWHHLTNLILHIAATLLLFGFLSYSTGEIRLSAIVAALFAWHPLHVESVAWIAERKDVLSAVTGFATLWAYAYYSRKPGIKRYGAVLFLFALGLLAKPMLVALPFVMLLLDFWPLKRPADDKPNLLRLVIEKLPLFALAVASAVITIIAQKGALRNFAAYDLITRISNALVSYCVYIGQVFWPGNLAVLYPYHRLYLPIVSFCITLLIAITVIVFILGKHRKYLITSWFWYLGTLLPVIGIVQVGSQAHADRYTYIPYVGLFVILVWGLNDFLAKISSEKKTLVRAALIVLCITMLLKTYNQVGYWKDGVTLLSHAIAVTKNNEIAHYNLGNIMQLQGRTDEAIAQYTASLRINPNKVNALANLAGIYFQMKQYEMAKYYIEQALDVAKATGDKQNIKDILDNIELLNQTMNSSQNETIKDK